MVIRPTLARVLICFGAGVFNAGVWYLSEWFSHRSHTIRWDSVAFGGLVMFAAHLFLWFGIPALARAEVRKKERKQKAASETEAAAQDATE